MEIENTDKIAIELEGKVRVRITNVLENIDQAKKETKQYVRQFLFYTVASMVFLGLQITCDALDYTVPYALSWVGWLITFILLMHYDNRAERSRGRVTGALMVLETLVPEAFLEDDKTVGV